MIHQYKGVSSPDDTTRQQRKCFNPCHHDLLPNISPRLSMQQINETDRKWDTYKALKNSCDLRRIHQAVTERPNTENLRQMAEVNLREAIDGHYLKV
jgi:hypothetical protein